MHNKDIIFDVENSRIGIAESDCSKGTSSFVDSPPNDNVEIINNYIIKRPLLIHSDWFTPSKLEITSPNIELTNENSAFLPNINNILKCYVADKVNELQSYELIIIVTGFILLIITAIFMIGSVFFRFRKNFLIFKYSNNNDHLPSPLGVNEIELNQTAI